MRSVLNGSKETAVRLPVVNEAGCYEIRLESIGGLGANLCGKLLGELGANYLGLNALSFSSYGSEKRGSPVRAYIRWCDAQKELRLNTPVEEPHLLGLFHEAMAGKLPVTAGAGAKTIVVFHTDASPDAAREKLRLRQGALWCIDALRIAMECKSRVNMVMLGALVRASGFIPLEPTLDLVEDTLGRKYPAALKANLEGVRQGYERAEGKVLEEDRRFPPQPWREVRSQWGYENAPLGGANPLFGSTVSNDLSASREGYIPLFLPEKCIHCGLCDSTCPDMVFQFEKGTYKGKETMVNSGLDYIHCKGCLRCVDVCPTGALVMGMEREYPRKPHFRPNKDLLEKHIAYEDAGPNSYVTSESYLTEKRVKGGLV